MKINFYILITAAIFFGACNNKPASNSAVNAADTTKAAGAATDTAAAVKGNPAPAGVTAVPDNEFLTTAYNVGEFEIKAAKLAKRMSEDKRVKHFAEMMIDDHTALNKDVLALLQKNGYTVPTELPDDLKAEYKYLNEWMGKDFERKYDSVNIAGHKDAIALFTKVSENGKDADVRKLAKDALPQLQMHEDSAQALLTHINTLKKW